MKNSIIIILAMNRVNDLFYRYKNGLLENTEIDDLERLLIESYFNSSQDLDQETSKYAEYLVIELYFKGCLPPDFNDLLKRKAEVDFELTEKISFRKKLNSSFSNKAIIDWKYLMTEKIDPEVEEKLIKIFDEIFRKIEAEEVKEPNAVRMIGFRHKIYDFIESFVSSLSFKPSKVRLAFAVISLITIFISGLFLFIYNGNKIEIAKKNSQNDKSTQLVMVQKSPNKMKKVLGKNYTKIEKGNNTEVENNESKPELTYGYGQTQKISMMLETISQGFLNGESFSFGKQGNPSTLLLNARESFIMKEYKTCLSFLDQFQKNYSSTNSDSINAVNFVNGTCFLLIAEKDNSANHYLSALNYFEKISRESGFFQYSKLGFLLSYIKLKNFIPGSTIPNHGKMITLPNKINADSLFDSFIKNP